MRTIPAAKLLPETPRFHIVARPRLRWPALLSDAPKLTILTAPAGFGKTTLLSEWRAALIERGERVAWLRLDQNDGSPTDFAAALLQSMRVAGHAVRDSDNTGRPWKETLAQLIGTLEDTATPHWLFLDDFHRAGADSANEPVSFLLRNAPCCLRVIIASRRKPDLPLSHMRVANQLAELSMHELSFDMDETRRFFREEVPGQVDLFDIDHFVELTHGWPAGLRMAAQELTQAKWHKHAVARFANPSQEVKTYFDECVAAELPGEELVALARASILDELDHPLCAAVAGEGAAVYVMRRLRQGEVLAERVDMRGDKFRLHPLFRRYLHSLLEGLPGDDPATLHERASEIHAMRQDWPRAVHHAFAAGNTAQAVEWAEQCALAEVGRGNLSAVLGWAGRVPREELLRRRLLLAAAGTSYALSQRLNEAHAVADAIEGVIASSQSASEIERLSLRRRVLRICIAYMSDDGASLLALAKESREADIHGCHRTVISNAFIHSYLIAGDLARARAAQVTGPLDCDYPEYSFSAVCQVCLLGLCDVAEGRFDQAERRFRDALELAERYAGPHTAPSVLAASLLSSVHYEYGNLDEAEAWLAGRLDLVEQTCFVEGLLAFYLTLARVHVARRQWQAAQSLLERGAELGRKRDWLRLRGACLAEQIRICLLLGRMATARTLFSFLRSLVPPEPILPRSPAAYVRQLLLLCEGRLLLASGKPQQACAVFDRYVREAAWDELSALQGGICWAVALFACGKRRLAVEAMTKLIVRSGGGGLRRSFLDAGQPAAELALAAVSYLREASHERVAPGYLDQLAETLNRAAQEEGWWTEPQRARRARLTVRERDLLGRIRSGMTNKEIAEDLKIGVETVKWHLKSIFKKLKVRNRAELVAHLHHSSGRAAARLMEL